MWLLRHISTLVPASGLVAIVVFLQPMTRLERLPDYWIVFEPVPQTRPCFGYRYY